MPSEPDGKMKRAYYTDSRYRFITKRHPGYQWLMDNANAVGFLGIKWTDIDNEPWHWEPIPSQKVI